MGVMKKNAFFVAATGQNVGKTTVCLGLVSGLKKRFGSVGYIKPVGQEFVEVELNTSVDKDVVLFKRHFQLPESYKTMSPILFPKGFTREYLDGKVDHRALLDTISTAFDAVASKNKISVIEGTGHTGVGSIVDLNNAQVAALLGAPLILIAPGGLGSSFDELSLNYAQCEKYGVRVVGVILNRVLSEKREMIIEYMGKALKKWNVPLLGCIPYDAFLSEPTMSDFLSLFDTELLSGSLHTLHHYQQIRLVASSLEMVKTPAISSELIITPATREDIISAAISREGLRVGMILTGKYPPKETILEQIRQANIPMIYVPLSSFITMKMINTHTAKIQEDDTQKIEEAVRIVEKHIDFDKLLKAIHIPH
jgi:phosphate acetyltransferase